MIKKSIYLLIYLPLIIYIYLKYNILRNEIIHWYDVLTGLKKTNTKLKRILTIISLLPEFRTYLYYKCKTHPLNPLKWMYKPQTNCYLPYDQVIGSGLIIQHGFNTIFNCESMGENCQVWQGVTIGKARSGINEPRPIIGNNVKICCNSVIIGGITIGDNVTIGAGAIVIKDVPPNCVVAGNPAKIIKYI